MVPAIVVPPVIPLALTTAKSRRDILAAEGIFANSSISFLVIPIDNFPFKQPIVAGIAPSFRIMDSMDIAVSRFIGNGMPCYRIRGRYHELLWWIRELRLGRLLPLRMKLHR
jgi:hypothetical protein